MCPKFLKAFPHKLIFLISLITCLLLCCFIPALPCGGELSSEGNKYHADPLQGTEPEILRFHVKADSNNLFDQQVKNEVASRILECFSLTWRDLENHDALRHQIIKDQEAITKTARQTLREHGFEQDVAVLLERSTFPARLYENNYYPPGEYEALMVVIGAGKGENWWCVLYPPLCFNVVPAPACLSEKRELHDTEQQDLSAENKKTNDEKKIRFWIVDYLKRN